MSETASTPNPPNPPGSPAAPNPANSAGSHGGKHRSGRPRRAALAPTATVAVLLLVAGGVAVQQQLGGRTAESATNGTSSSAGGTGGSGATDGAGGTSHANGAVFGTPRTEYALAGFNSCEPLLSYYRKHALELVGPYGLDGNFAIMQKGLGMPSASMAASAPMPEARAAAGASDGAVTAAGAASGTNVQVAGVDELDVAKRHGDLLLTVQPGRPGDLKPQPGAELAPSPGPDYQLQQGTVLRLTRLAHGQAAAVGRLALPGLYAEGLLVDGDTAAVVGAALTDPNATARKRAYWTATQRSAVAEIDISDPAHPRLRRTLTLDGRVTGVRLVDGVVRLALLNSPHDLNFRTPEANADGTVDQAGLEAATEANREIVRTAGLDAFLPGYQVTTGATDGAMTGPSTDGRLVDCANVAAPQQFSGLETLSLVSLDLRAGGVADPSAAAVIASGTTMYATADRSYLATTTWQGGIVGTGGGPQPMIARDPMGGLTQIHAFDTTGRQAPAYLGSGSVNGRLVGQFAMDDYQGVLRVASTTWQPIPPVAPDAGIGADPAGPITPSPIAPPGGGVVSSRPMTINGGSVSQVTTLQLQDGRLRQVGLVSGLGRGEQIRGVRFDGPLGFVVTFRQTDPLYTVDLADPAHPRVAGELKLLGYSAYLHPLDGGRLLGLGQDADGAGRLRGAQISLFDVARPDAPQRLSQVTLANAWNLADGDHHAVTVFDDLVLVPYQATNLSVPEAGVLMVRLDGNRLVTSHQLNYLTSDGATAQRTFIDGTDIWTLTDTGLVDHDRTTGRRLSFLPLGNQ